MKNRDKLEPRLAILAEAMGLKVGHDANNLCIDGNDKRYRIEQIGSDGKGSQPPFGPERYKAGELLARIDFAVVVLEMKAKLDNPTLASE